MPTERKSFSDIELKELCVQLSDEMRLHNFIESYINKMTNTETLIFIYTARAIRAYMWNLGYIADIETLKGMLISNPYEIHGVIFAVNFMYNRTPGGPTS